MTDQADSPVFPEFFHGDSVKYLSDKVLHHGTTCFVESYKPGDDIIYLQQSMYNGGFISVKSSVSDVVLIRRGNHFLHHFGLPLLPMSIVFAMNFWRSVGLAEQVFNPTNGWAVWEEHDAVKALQGGDIHFTAYASGFAGLPAEVFEFFAYRLKGAALQDVDRLRDHSLAELAKYGVLVSA